MEGTGQRKKAAGDSGGGNVRCCGGGPEWGQRDERDVTEAWRSRGRSPQRGQRMSTEVLTRLTPRGRFGLWGSSLHQVLITILQVLIALVAAGVPRGVAHQTPTVRQQLLLGARQAAALRITAACKHRAEENFMLKVRSFLAHMRHLSRFVKVLFGRLFVFRNVTFSSHST